MFKNKIRFLLLLLVFLSALAGAEVRAATLTVRNSADAGGSCPGADCTLRQAIITASSGDTITFDMTTVTSPITLSGELLVNKSLTITGPGASLLSVSGNNAVRVINIPSGSFNINLSGLTIANGHTDNSTYGGAGISSGASALTITDSVISGNNSDLNAGGIACSGMLTLINSTVSGNNSLGSAAGISNGGILKIYGSTISGNVGGNNGGGILNNEGGGNAIIVNSTISGNSSYNSGGGISNIGQLKIINSTVFNNTSIVGVGGVANPFGIGTQTVNNTIIAGNNSQNSIYADVAGNFTSSFNNVIGISDGSTGFTNGVNGNIVGTSAAPIDPRLAPLANNCGATQTRALLSTSPAINAGSNALAVDASNQPLATDQRGAGFPRIVGAAVDIGAFEFNQAQAPCSPTVNRTLFDFDGDGKADLSIFRPDANPANPDFYIRKSADNTLFGYSWGLPGDRLAPADYDGDGKTDIAVWRENTGDNEAYFYILNSSSNTARVEQYGLSGDKLMVGDWDGDGKADPATYRDSAVGSQSSFYYRGSLNNANGNVTYLPWGTSGDKPMRGDFDGDGKQDLAVYRASNQTWYIRNSSDSQQRFVVFGLSTDKFIPADYDGDGKTDIAVFRSGIWYILKSSNGQILYQTFGQTGDQTVPADYDGDGKTDIAVFRPNNNFWYILPSASSIAQYAQFGQTGDVAVPSAYIQ